MNKCTICGNQRLGVLTKTLRRGSGIVYYCPECDYGMLAPAYEDMVSYYDNEYRKHFSDILNDKEEQPEEIYEMRKNYQNDRIKIIEPYFDISKSFLEIGCSAGQFISKIVGNFSKIEGIELSKSCAQFVKDKWNIEIKTQPLEQIDWDGEQFDYIAFFQVLEHIENPKDFLYVVKKVMKKDGRIFIEVPSLNDPLRKLWNVPEYGKFYYHEAHLSYFSEKSLRLLLNECGLCIEKIFFIQDYNFLNNVHWFFTGKPQEDCKFGLNAPEISFKDDDENIRNAAQEINMLFQETNKKYFEILGSHRLTSNIFAVVKAMK